MVRIIHNLADIYGLRVVAEGVGTLDQLNYLRNSGDDWAQGRRLSQPVTKDALVELLVEMLTASLSPLRSYPSNEPKLAVPLSTCNVSNIGSLQPYTKSSNMRL